MMSNFIILMAYLFPKYQAVLKTLGGLVVALAAPTYAVLSTALIFRGQILALKSNICLTSVVCTVCFRVISVMFNEDVFFLFTI